MLRKLFLLPLILIVSCGGGGDDDSSADIEDVNGFYSGLLTYPDGEVSFIQVHGLIYEGNLYWVGNDENWVIQGALRLDGSRLRGTVEIFEDDRDLTFTNGIDATYEPRVSIDGVLLVDDGPRLSEPGQLALDYDPQYEKDISIAALAGTFSGTNGDGADFTLAVNGDGTFSGVIQGGITDCVFTGNISIPDASINVYRLTGNATDCFNGSGPATGYASLLTSASANDTVAFFLTAGGTPLYIVGIRD